MSLVSLLISLICHCWIKVLFSFKKWQFFLSSVMQSSETSWIWMLPEYYTRVTFWWCKTEVTKMIFKIKYKSNTATVSPLSCVSCVPASCFLIWFVSCPRLMWLSVNSCPAVFMWLCVNYPVYLVPVFWVWFGLVYSLLPVFPVCQPCLVLPCLH